MAALPDRDGGARLVRRMVSKFWVISMTPASWSQCMLLPMLLRGYLAANSPGLAGTLLRWLPSTLLVDAVKASFVAHVAWGEVLPGLGVVLASTALLLAVVIWWVRRTTR